MQKNLRGCLTVLGLLVVCSLVYSIGPSARAHPGPTTPSPTGLPGRPVFYSESQRDILPPPPGGYSIHGVYPGLFRCEIEERLGEPLRTGKYYGIYADGRGSTVNVQFHLRNVARSVDGAQLERDGEVLAKLEDFGYPSDAKKFRVSYDYFCQPVAFHLPEKKGGRFVLPSPGSSHHIMEFSSALRDTAPVRSRKVLESHPEITFARILPDGETALHLVARTNYEELALDLIAEGADTNAKSFEGRTPLHLAKTIGMARLLVEHGAATASKDRSGLTPLKLAIRWKKDSELVQYLRENTE